MPANSNNVTHLCGLLLGSNTGERFSYIDTAVDIIRDEVGVVQKESAYYETAAWGNTGQPDFLNKALLVHTTLSPHALMNTILEIENRMGRRRLKKWDPRIIDIDILFYKDAVINEPDLKLPHPFMHQRRFALVPLKEIYPDWVHPVLNKNMDELLNECEDELPVKKLQR